MSKIGRLFSRYFCLGLLLGAGLFPLAAQNINQAEFIDKPIREILATLGAIGGRSIVVDDTVTGNATHYLNSKTFEQALQVVLETNHLYKTEKNGVLLISRIRIEEVDPTHYSASADNIDLETFVRRLARDTQKTVLYDSFPRMNLDISMRSATMVEFLNTILTKLPGFALEINGQSYYLRNVQAQAKTPGTSTPGGKLVTESNGRYAIHARNVKLSDVLDSLFASAKKEYSVIKKGDSILDRISFDDKDFEQLLRLILELGDADYTVQNGLYYIVEVNRTDILKKFETTRKVDLKYLSVTQLVNLMPGALANGNAFKIDKAGNSLILNGSSEETGPIMDFIGLVDKPLDGMQYYRFDLMYVQPDAILAVLPESLKSSDPIVVKGQSTLLFLLSPERMDLARSLISMLDKPKSPYVVKLKYIKADDLMAKLPSFISKDLLSVSYDQRYVFFTGSKDQYADLTNQLRFIDIPVPQIKYQVLVVQYQESVATDLGLDFSRAKGAEKDLSFVGDSKNFALLGTIGKALSLNFDIVADFGYLFATSLSASMSNNKASVLLDTTLNALTNQDVTFKNTNTYRYADKETNQDTGTTATTKTITREIVSGIILTMKGWVSGDGMISMNINATITKRGGSDSSSSIPQTYEKVITTSVRTPSGKPIVVGGLMQHDTGYGTDLLKLHDESQNTELMIYIIPRVETPLFYDNNLSESLMYLYNQYSPNGERQDVL